MGTPTITLEMTAAGVRPMRMLGDTDLVIIPGRFTFSSDYATGGESLTAANLNVQQLLFVSFTPVFSGGTAIKGAVGPYAEWNPATSKVWAISPSAVPGGLDFQQEAPAHANFSTYTYRFIAIGYK